MSVMETVKAHPYLMGSAALGTIVIVLLLVKPKSGAPTNASVDTGASDAAVAAANAQGYAAQLQTSRDVTIANLASETSVRTAEIAASSKLAEDGLSANVALSQLEHTAAVTLAGIDASKTVQLAGVDAGRVIQLGAQQTQVSIAGLQSSERIAEMDAMRDMSIAHERTLAEVQHDASQSLIAATRINADTSNHIIDANANVALHQIDANILIAHDQTAADMAARADAEARRGENQIWTNNAAVVAAQGNQAGAAWFLAQRR